MAYNVYDELQKLEITDSSPHIQCCGRKPRSSSILLLSLIYSKTLVAVNRMHPFSLCCKLIYSVNEYLPRKSIAIFNSDTTIWIAMKLMHISKRKWLVFNVELVLIRTLQGSTMFSGLTQHLANVPLALIELIIQSFRSCKYNMETKY